MWIHWGFGSGTGLAPSLTNSVAGFGGAGLIQRCPWTVKQVDGRWERAARKDLLQEQGNYWEGHGWDLILISYIV